MSTPPPKNKPFLIARRTRGDFPHVGRPSAKVACCTTTCCLFLITAAVGGLAGFIYGASAKSTNSNAGGLRELAVRTGCGLLWGFIGFMAGGAAGLFLMKLLSEFH